jgi:hypothetical protein
MMASAAAGCERHLGLGHPGRTALRRRTLRRAVRARSGDGSAGVSHRMPSSRRSTRRSGAHPDRGCRHSGRRRALSRRNSGSSLPMARCCGCMVAARASSMPTDSRSASPVCWSMSPSASAPRSGCASRRAPAASARSNIATASRPSRSRPNSAACSAFIRPRPAGPTINAVAGFGERLALIPRQQAPPFETL